MNRFRVFPIFLLFVFFSCLTVDAGDKTCFVSRTGIYRFESVLSADPRHRSTNEILKELANAAVKNLKSTKLFLKGDLLIVLDSGSNGNCYLNLALSRPELGGDNHFRGFDVSEVLLPTRLDVILVVFDTAERREVPIYSVEDNTVRWNEGGLPQQISPCFDPGIDSLRISAIKFYHDENTLGKFRERISLIDDYYASSALLDSLKILASSIDLRRTSQFLISFLHLEEINKTVEIIRKKDFPGFLHLNEHDPKGFLEKFDEINKLSKSLTMTFLERLEETGFIQISAPEDSVIGSFFSGLMRYLNWMMLVNDRNGRIYKEYLDAYFSLPAFADDIGILKTILRKTFPDDNPDSVMIQLFARVHSGYKSRVMGLMNEYRYAEAIELIENGRHFLHFYPIPGKQEDYDSLWKLAVNGICSSYIGIAESAIKNRKFEIAGSYLKKSRSYRIASSSGSLSDSLYRKVFLDLVRGQLSTCDSLALVRKFEESLDCYGNMEREHDTISISTIRQDLNRKRAIVYSGFINDLIKKASDHVLSEAYDSALILFDFAVTLVPKSSEAESFHRKIDSVTPAYDRIRYDQAIYRAGRNHELRHIPAAYSQLNKAKVLSMKHNHIPDPVFDSLWARIYPAYLKHLLMVSERLIWLNRLDEAARFADSIYSVQVRTGLDQDPGMVFALEKFRKRISEKVCLNAKEASEIFFLRAEYHLGNKNFLQTERLLDSAIINHRSVDCNLPVDAFLDTLKKYRDAISFQQSMKEISDWISIGRNEEALNKYLDAELFFVRNSVSRFGLDCQPMEIFIRGKSNLHITFAAIELFQKRSEEYKAFSFLKLFRLQGGEAGDVKEIQRTIGKEIANSDFLRFPEKDPAILLEDYTGHDKWMTVFERAYIYQWNVLRHESGSNPDFDE